LIRVCDAIMGTGKTSAAITYINEHPEKRFVFITPYLNEATRIRTSCPNAHFVEPSANIGKFGYSKVKHTAALIQNGRNIATTHQAFRNYSAGMMEDITFNNYTLVVDENVDVLESVSVGRGDMASFIESGRLVEKDGAYYIGDREYEGGKYDSMFEALGSRALIRADMKSGKGSRASESFFYWMLSPELISAFNEVIVLTYMFEGQSLCHMMKLNGLPYEYIGVERTADGGYRFGETGGYIPDYVQTLSSRIHILGNRRMNSIGEMRTALSMNWYKDGGRLEELRTDLYNYFNGVCRECPAGQRMCASFVSFAGRIKGKGYTKSIVPFNLRATNDYRDKTCLAYPVNVFMNASAKVYFYEHGVEVDEDAYALSTMVQWIWRSAIREGGEIDVYIPSLRMRTLLKDWIDTVSKGAAYGAA